MPKTIEILSSPELQEGYRLIAPEFVDGLRKMVEQEQLHRASIGKSQDYAEACESVDSDWEKVITSFARLLKSPR